LYPVGSCRLSASGRFCGGDVQIREERSAWKVFWGGISGPS